MFRNTLSKLSLQVLYDGRLIGPSRILDLKFEPVGCFRDKPRPRAMPELLKNFRGTIDWSDLSKTVQKCADEAMNKRKLGGMQFTVSSMNFHMIKSMYLFWISFHQKAD